MSHLIEVAFKGNRKEFFFWDGDDPPRLRAPIIVEGDRGEDLGRVHAIGEAAEHRFLGVPHGAMLYGGGPGAQPGKRALRVATPDDVRKLDELTEQNELARRKSIERVKAHGLVMKVSDAEWQWDRRKLTLYFTAEKRVDFRGLVRDLAALFRTRIELKQIGVRDEAKRLDGVGRCGREYCSSSWLPELRPVNLSVAKDQHLSLNPTQISGACGRLMCSLRYEHEFYVQARKRFPKEGRILVTLRGEEKVLANDIFRDRVSLRGSDGETRIVSLVDLRREMSGDTDDAREPLGSGSDAVSHDDDESYAETSEAPEVVPASERRRSDRRRGMDARQPLPVLIIEETVQVTLVEAAPLELLDVAERRTTIDDDDDAASDDAGTDAPDAAATGTGDEGMSETPRPRRRRGRRGGRRGRGSGGASTTDAQPSTDAPNDSTSD